MKNRKLLIIGAAAGLLIVICACCAVFGLISPDSNEAAQRPTTRTPLPPLTTDTPLPPTPTTSSPTLLPSPTNPPPPIEPSPTNTSPAELPPPTAAQERSSQIDPSVVAGSDTVNLRAGPGTNYPVAGSLAPAQTLPITGRNADSSWWQVSTVTGPAWVAASVVTTVNTSDAIPIVEAPPAPTPLPAATATLAPTSLPAPTATPIQPAPAPLVPPDVQCDCSANLYNCNDGSFSSDAEAQGCYLHCLQSGAGDVHDLDRDSDGNACEWGK